MRWAGHVARMGEERGVCRVLVGILEGKRPLERSRTRWADKLLMPYVNYSGRTAPLTSKVAFYIFIQQIWVMNILNMVYTFRLFLFKMQFVS